MRVKKALTIAGFDNSGGAGLQADLKTFSAFGCYGMSVVTAVAAQNTQGVKTCYPIEIASISDQLQTIFDDIKPDVIKIGMLFNHEIIEVVSQFLIKNAKLIPIILDPVMYAKSGHKLLKDNAIESLIKHMLPLAYLVTPNLPEALKIANFANDCKYNFKDINSLENSQLAEVLAKQIIKFGSKAVLVKGGHFSDDFATDLLFFNQQFTIYKDKKINSNNTHGTGCTLSAAIASALALDNNLITSISLAKKFVVRAILASQDSNIGLGRGPLHHFYHLWPSIDKI